VNPRCVFVARPSDDGRRLDVVVADRLKRSRTACAALAKRDMVFVDGAPAKAAHVVRAGERIRVEMPAPVEPSAKPDPIPIRIVYQDRDLCVVDKPAGMATHPAPGSPSGTLVNALLAAIGPLPAINGVLRPGIVHRLDKGTSGLLVVAKSDRAMIGLSKSIARREVLREYDAVVWGIPRAASGTIEAPIGRDVKDRKKFAVRAAGRAAVTHYQVKERFRVASQAKGKQARASLELSRLRLTLATGRTHQIRVHAAAIGHPVAGDPTYAPGRPSLGVSHQLLHAARLRFTHPVTGAAMDFQSPWPDDFAAVVARLRPGELE
jgi:23S rRNA pseudouridine1911/1915/1917 synthase